jgi:hypothetical protein
VRANISFPPANVKCAARYASISIYVMNNSGMEKRPRRFSLPEAFFEGSRTGGREDCLSMWKSRGEGREWSLHTQEAEIYHAEFRTAKKNAEGTASKT